MDKAAERKEWERRQNRALFRALLVVLLFVTVLGLQWVVFGVWLEWKETATILAYSTAILGVAGFAIWSIER